MIDRRGSRKNDSRHTENVFLYTGNLYAGKCQVPVYSMDSDLSVFFSDLFFQVYIINDRLCGPFDPEL